MDFLSCFQLNEISIRFKILFSFRSLISMLSPSSDVDFQRISSWLVHLRALCISERSGFTMMT